MNKKNPVSNDKNSMISCNIMNLSNVNNQKKKAEWRLSQQLKAEQEEFTTLALNEPLPTTLSGYKNHPLYTLHRDLKVRGGRVI
jgi:Rad4 beta-hairpin domain 1